METGGLRQSTTSHGIPFCFSWGSLFTLASKTKGNASIFGGHPIIDAIATKRIKLMGVQRTDTLFSSFRKRWSMRSWRTPTNVAWPCASSSGRCIGLGWQSVGHLARHFLFIYFYLFYVCFFLIKKWSHETVGVPLPTKKGAHVTTPRGVRHQNKARKMAIPQLPALRLVDSV